MKKAVLLLLALFTITFSASPVLAKTVKIASKASAAKAGIAVKTKKTAVKLAVAKKKKHKISAATASDAAVDSAPVAGPVSMASCMKAVKKANRYCKSVGRGCNSWDTSAKCQAANAACEKKQTAALDLCPNTNPQS